MAESNDGADTLSEEKNLNYCISLSGSGTQSKRSSHHEDFLPLIEQSSISWVDIKVEEIHKEAIDIATKFGFSKEMVKQLLTRSADGRRFQGGYQDFDAEMGLLFPVIRIEGFNVTISPIFILLKKGLILTIRSYETHIFHNLHRYAETYLEKLPQNLQLTDWLSLMLIRIIDENNERNFEQLQKIEEGSEDLTQDFKSENVLHTDFGEKIVQMKQALITYLSGLWKTLDTLNSLSDSDAALVSDEAQVLDKMNILVRDVRDQINVAENTSDVLASGLEFLQSIYNNQLQVKNNLLQDKNNQLADRNNALQEKNNRLSEYNNRLTLHNNRLSLINNRITLLGGLLAIIGAGFVVPNTIATMLSQTNIFQFSPADMGWYVALIVTSTIVATLIAWLWVKRMGLLPKKQEGESLIAETEKQKKE